MPSLGSGEIVIIVVLVLLLFGPNRLPELARGIGRGMREIRKVTGEFQNQLSQLADEEDRRKMPIQFPDETPEQADQTPRLDQKKWEPHPDFSSPERTEIGDSDAAPKHTEAGEKTDA